MGIFAKLQKTRENDIREVNGDGNRRRGFTPHLDELPNNMPRSSSLFNEPETVSKDWSRGGVILELGGKERMWDTGMRNLKERGERYQCVRCPATENCLGRYNALAQ